MRIKGYGIREIRGHKLRFNVNEQFNLINMKYRKTLQHIIKEHKFFLSLAKFRHIEICMYIYSMKQMLIIFAFTELTR